MKLGDTVYINSPKAKFHGERGEVVAVDHTRAYPYRVRIRGRGLVLWFPEAELSEEEPGERLEIS